MEIKKYGQANLKRRVVNYFKSLTQTKTDQYIPMGVAIKNDDWRE